MKKDEPFGAPYTLFVYCTTEYREYSALSVSGESECESAGRGDELVVVVADPREEELYQVQLDLRGSHQTRAHINVYLLHPRQRPLEPQARPDCRHQGGEREGRQLENLVNQFNQLSV